MRAKIKKKNSGSKRLKEGERDADGLLCYSVICMWCGGRWEKENRKVCRWKRMKTKIRVKEREEGMRDRKRKKMAETIKLTEKGNNE